MGRDLRKDMLRAMSVSGYKAGLSDGFDLCAGLIEESLRDLYGFGDKRLKRLNNDLLHRVREIDKFK